MVKFKPSFYSKLRERVPELLQLYGDSIKDEPRGKRSYFGAICSRSLGAVTRLLGDAEGARRYFSDASAYYWPHDSFDSPSNIKWADNDAKDKCMAGVTGSLAGIDGSERLFSGAVAVYRTVPESLYKIWEPGPNKEEYPDDYARLFVYWAYAAARTSAWSEAMTCAANAVRGFKRCKQLRRTHFHHEYRLALALEALCRYKMDPTELNRELAQSTLEQIFDGVNEPLTRAETCIFVWDLQSAFPDVYQPVLPM